MLKVREMKVKALKPWKENPRLNEKAVEAVMKSIKRFGFNVPIICNQEYRVIAGHTRLKAAKQLSMSTVPVIVLSMDDVASHSFAIAENKTGEIADRDRTQLSDILKSLESDEENITDLGFSEGELQALLSPENDFDWDGFEKNLKAENEKIQVLVPVKIPVAMKESMKKALTQYAKKHNIQDKDFALQAGKSLILLLGVKL